MKWRDPQPTRCPACEGEFPLPVADIRSLKAVCPGCGASLADVCERMVNNFAQAQARFSREIGPFCVGFELEEEVNLGLPDDKMDTVKSLNDLVRVVADQLGHTPDREWRAATLVADAAHRAGYTWLLDETDSDVVRMWLRVNLIGQ